MYDNIGGKIKSLAKAVFIIVAIAATIIGFVFMTHDDDLFLIGLFVMVAGYILGWISSLLIYGFGELIDKVCDIERNTRGESRSYETQEKVDFERICKIENLRSQGLITEEEYQQAIAKDQ